jgi:hypothetical protein
MLASTDEEFIMTHDKYAMSSSLRYLIELFEQKLMNMFGVEKKGNLLFKTKRVSVVDTDREQVPSVFDEFIKNGFQTWTWDLHGGPIPGLDKTSIEKLHAASYSPILVFAKFLRIDDESNFETWLRSIVGEDTTVNISGPKGVLEALRNVRKMTFGR